MKKLFKFIVFLIIIASIAGAAWYGAEFLGQSKKETQAASFISVTKGDIESVVTAQGKLEPKEYVDVGAQVSGKIEKLHVEIGDTVKTGDLIAEIDPDLYESQVVGDEARVKTLQAQKAEQEAQVKQAKQKLERNKKLIEQKAISREVYEDAQTTLEIAQAQIQSLKAQIEEAQSAFDGSKANLNYTKIYAPMDGTVVSQETKEGQTINASQTAPVIVQVANLDIMTVRAQVAEADVSKLKPDMPVYFTTLGSQNRRWQATIRQILPSPETVNDVVLYNVLVDVENKDRQLMTGMTTQMFFVLGNAKDAVLVPVSALTKRVPESDTDAAKAYEVQVAEGKGLASRTVMIGLSDRSQAEILSGLKEGDRISVQAPESTPASSSSTQRTRIPGMGRI